LTPGQVRVGCSGWAIPRAQACCFPSPGNHLQRYAGRLDAVEIDSSFYCAHRPATYARWAATVPAGFHFAVKVPREITHQRRLVEAEAVLVRFLGEVASLGDTLGPLLVQLPPSLAFEAASVARFFQTLRGHFPGAVACEPRHTSWLASEPEALLSSLQVARVAADPPPNDGAAEPGGWPGLVYCRLHGSPRIYYSSYDGPALARWAEKLRAAAAAGAEAWCILDNTAAGAAIPNALYLRDLLAGPP